MFGSVLDNAYFAKKLFLQERRVDFFGRCFAVPRKLSRGPKKDRGSQFENHWSKGLVMVVVPSPRRG